MVSDTWSFLGTGLNVTFYGLPAIRPIPSTEWAYQNHLVVEAEVIHQLILAITGLVTIRAQPG